MRLWRISDFADLAGEGGLLVSGRWHSRGRRIVYLSDHPATALIEISGPPGGRCERHSGSPTSWLQSRCPMRSPSKPSTSTLCRAAGSKTGRRHAPAAIAGSQVNTADSPPARAVCDHPLRGELAPQPGAPGPSQSLHRGGDARSVRSAAVRCNLTARERTGSHQPWPRHRELCAPPPNHGAA